MISSAARKFSVEENIANRVLRIHLRSADAAEFNVTFEGNVGPDQIATNIGDGNLAALGFQINGRIDRHLEFEIHIADIAASAIVGHHVNDQRVAGLPRRDIGLGRFEGGGELDLVAIPRLDRDGAGDIFQFDADIFCRPGIVFDSCCWAWTLLTLSAPNKSSDANSYSFE